MYVMRLLKMLVRNVMPTKVTARKLTNEYLMQEVCGDTTGKESAVSLAKMYAAEHSPIRTQLFAVKMVGVPTFVSVHLVRHKIGVEHFVRSNREDRGGADDVTRETPVTHSMIVNAAALIQIARKRLCHQAHTETTRVVGLIKRAVARVDPHLADVMVPECIYRGGICHELRQCEHPPKGVVHASDLDEVSEKVVSLVRHRAVAGKRRYGVGLSRSDLSIDQWLQHATEECADLIGYLCRLMGSEFVPSDQLKKESKLPPNPPQKLPQNAGVYSCSGCSGNRRVCVPFYSCGPCNPLADSPKKDG